MKRIKELSTIEFKIHTQLEKSFSELGYNLECNGLDAQLEAIHNIAGLDEYPQVIAEKLLKEVTAIMEFLGKEKSKNFYLYEIEHELKEVLDYAEENKTMFSVLEDRIKISNSDEEAIGLSYCLTIDGDELGTFFCDELLREVRKYFLYYRDKTATLADLVTDIAKVKIDKLEAIAKENENDTEEPASIISLTILEIYNKLEILKKINRR